MEMPPKEMCLIVLKGVLSFSKRVSERNNNTVIDSIIYSKTFALFP